MPERLQDTPEFSLSTRRALGDRSAALAERIDSLQARVSSKDVYALALEMCQRYARLFVKQLDRDWDRTPDPRIRAEIFRGHVRTFNEREEFILKRFARGYGDVPRALQTMARRHFASHGLNGYEPLLTLGPPEGFHTDKHDLREFLFRALDAIQPEEYVGIPRTPKLAIINVPNIGGTNAVWHPIVIGHEIAHIRVRRDAEAGEHIDATQWVNEFDPDLAALMNRADARTEEEGAGIVDAVNTVIQRWVNELLCDLNAVRLFGPGGLYAIAEQLRFYRRQSDQSADEPTAKYPRLFFRVEFMTQFLQVLGEKVDLWPEYRRIEKERGQREMDPVHSYVEGLIMRDENSDAIMRHAIGWGEVYLHRTREPQIDWLTRELLDGIPGGTHCPETEPDSEVKVADIVNATWRARETIDAGGAADGEGVRDRLALLDATFLSDHERRLCLDALATKAIDSVEFALLWRLTGDPVPVFDASDFPGRPQPPGAVLSRRAVEERLRSTDLASRLVMTPLVGDAVQDAGIDLRLSPEFIAFRHSATAAFEVIGEQDPRALQERVEKAWGDPFILHPGELVLAATLEYVVLPKDLAAHVVTRSSYGRLGLITATAVQVQPGSRGCITLELVNHSETPISLMPGSRVAELVFFTVEGATDASPNKYWFPTGPEFSKVQRDPDAQALATIGSGSHAALERSPQASRDLSRVSVRFAGSQSHVTRCATIIESVGSEVEIEVIRAPEGSVEEALERALDLSSESHQANAVTSLETVAAVTVRFALAVSTPIRVTLRKAAKGDDTEATPETECLLAVGKDLLKQRFADAVAATGEGELPPRVLVEVAGPNGGRDVLVREGIENAREVHRALLSAYASVLRDGPPY